MEATRAQILIKPTRPDVTAPLCVPDPPTANRDGIWNVHSAQKSLVFAKFLVCKSGSTIYPHAP
jgi:hypothetical protein